METVPSDIPGAEFVVSGLADLVAGRDTVNALLVAQAPERLRAAGVPVPAALPVDPEAGLYRLLETEEGDGAHARYNALRRRLESFCVAMEADARRRHR